MIPNTLQIDQYEDDFLQKIIYELKTLCAHWAHQFKYYVLFDQNNAPWARGRSQCESLDE